MLVLHWTGADGTLLQGPAFMDAVFGPGAPLSEQRFYLIFADSIGHGQSSRPSDGLKAGFPRYGYRDMIDLQHRLVTEVLGINRLRAILGLSMGGMNAWQWAGLYPNAVDAIMPVASLPLKISGPQCVVAPHGDQRHPLRSRMAGRQLRDCAPGPGAGLRAVAPDD